MTGEKKDSEIGEIRRSDSVMQAYHERLMVLRHAQDFAARGDVPKAVERYSTYLNTLASYYKTTEDRLSPNLFSSEKEITELLLISHAYWYLTKAYDRSPKLIKEFQRCLEQFVRFSSGYKFQHVNAQMLKKYIRKRQAHNPKDFSKAYEKIYVKAKGCFIATYAFGDKHPLTQDFRAFKLKLLKSSYGLFFVTNYYRFSPAFTHFLIKHPLIGKPLRLFLFKPLLKLIHRYVHH